MFQMLSVGDICSMLMRMQNLEQKNIVLSQISMSELHQVNKSSVFVGLKENVVYVSVTNPGHSPGGRPPGLLMLPHFNDE